MISRIRVGAVTRFVDELLWMLRRRGMAIATSQAIDAVRAIHAVGFESKDLVREALAAVVVLRQSDRARFDRAFDEYFAAAAGRSEDRNAGATFWERLAARFDETELAMLRELLDAQATAAEASADEGADSIVLGRGAAFGASAAELDRVLLASGVRKALAPLKSRKQVGFFHQRALDATGFTRAQAELSRLRRALEEALGARGAEMADAIAQDLARMQDQIRAHVRQTAETREDALQAKENDDARRLEVTDFAALSPEETLDVRRAVRTFVQKLCGGERVRRRHANRGRIDPHRTLRRSLATSGVPLSPARKRRRRGRPRLVLLCDVSDSVRATARFMLELTYAAQLLFERTRSFVFVRDLGDASALFEKEPIERALALAYGGAIVPVHDLSNYGRALRTFEARHLELVDRRTVVVVLGDGRTNYQDDGAASLGKIRARARAVVWLTPEGRGSWLEGDSAMARYERNCTNVLTVRCASELEDAARVLIALR